MAPKIFPPPDTGTFGVGVSVGIEVGARTNGLDVGTGVAVTAGQRQLEYSIHSDFLHRFTPPVTIEQINPDEQFESLSHDASQIPGPAGG